MSYRITIGHVWVLLFSSSLFAQSAAKPPPVLPRDQWGAPPVNVYHEGDQWLIAGEKNKVTWSQSDLAFTVHTGPVKWRMVPSGPNDIRVRAGGRDYSIRLADAKKIDTTPYDTGYKTGVKITLSHWTKDVPLPLTLFLTVCLEGKDEELVFDVAADEREVIVRRLDWPTALDSREIDCTILSNVRGILLPRDWPEEYKPIRGDKGFPGDTSEIQSNVIECWSMSWWGFQKGSSAMMVIVETPDDAAYQFSHPAGGPTVIGPRWRPTLGKLGYPRTARMCFFPQGNYVDMAKRYRRYAMDTGLFVSLQEKIARKPVVKELMATPLMRAGILTNIKPGGVNSNIKPQISKMWNPQKADDFLSFAFCILIFDFLLSIAFWNDNYRLTTFDDRAKFFRRLKSEGLDRLTVVLTGWPRLGYDRQHPDALPPAPEAGGWEGMKRLADTCRELGYLFSLHDQYRDFYIDAPSYDPQFAIHEEDAASHPQAFPGTRFGSWKEGPIPFMDYWDGGKMTYLNGRFMLGHLMKNYRWLFDRGIRPQGSYLDVFGYVPPDEDFNPEHPTTRSDCLGQRAKCYNWSRNNLGFVGTEAACDWTIPYADISSPLRSRNGVTVPLFNLVYHDAIMTTYGPDDLHGFLNAGVPQIGAREPGKDDMARIRRMIALNKRVALLEMTKHEFLEEKYRTERTTFSDGTTVTVDWDARTVEVKPELNY